MTFAESVSAQTNFTVLQLFRPPAGGVPGGPPVESRDGAFYGVTAGGGISNMGTVFKFERESRRYTTLKSFVGTDGQTPLTALTVGTNGVLFGTTYSGGQYNFGTVFTLQTNGAGFQVLHHFSGGSDSKNPSGALIQGKDGALYGMTSYSSGTTRGTIFKVNQDGTVYSIVHNFSGNPDGQQPAGRLLQTSSGVIFGTTGYGGSSTQPGVVFRLNPDGSSYWVIHTFGGAGDGRMPIQGLTAGSDGLLYGATYQGGSAGSGSIFRMDEYGGSYSVLHSFLNTGGDGIRPNSELVEAANGMLYGTTYQGGVGGGGTLFKLAKDGSSYTIVRHFSTGGSNLNTPIGVFQARDGILYGSTQYGGGNGAGCIFALTTSPLTPRILSLFVNGDSATVQCATTSAIRYEVQQSTNLSFWLGLSTLTSPDNGELWYTNLGQHLPASFYRLHQR